MNRDLADVFGNFVNRILKFCETQVRRRRPGRRRARRARAEALSPTSRRALAELTDADGGDRDPQVGAGAAGALGARQRVPAGGRALDRDQDRPRPGGGDRAHGAQPRGPVRPRLGADHPVRGRGRSRRRWASPVRRPGRATTPPPSSSRLEPAARSARRRCCSRRSRTPRSPSGPSGSAGRRLAARTRRDQGPQLRRRPRPSWRRRRAPPPGRCSRSTASRCSSLRDADRRESGQSDRERQADEQHPLAAGCAPTPATASTLSSDVDMSAMKISTSRSSERASASAARPAVRVATLAAQVPPHLPADQQQQQAAAQHQPAAAGLQQLDGEDRQDAEQHDRAREPSDDRQVPLRRAAGPTPPCRRRRRCRWRGSGRSGRPGRRRREGSASSCFSGRGAHSS